MIGEVSTSGRRTGKSARGSSGVSGATCRERRRDNWGDPRGPLREGREKSLGIRWYRNPRKSARESDEVIVPWIPKTTELRGREGPLLWVLRKKVRSAHCES